MAFNTGPYRDVIQGRRREGDPVYQPDGDYGQTARAAGTPYYSFENTPTGPDLGSTYGKSESDPRIWSDPEFENELTSAMLNFQNTPLGQELMKIFQGGPGETAMSSIGNLQGISQEIADMPDYYSEAEKAAISRNITGESFDRGVGGSLFDQISRAVAPQIDAERARLGKSGINPEAVAGVLSGAIGERDRAYTDAATRYMLQGQDIGLRGRGMEETATMGRLGVREGIERFIPQFMEGSEQWRTGVGQDLLSNQMNVYQFLLELSRQQDMMNKQGKFDWNEFGGNLLSSGAQIGAASMTPVPA